MMEGSRDYKNKDKKAYLYRMLVREFPRPFYTIAFDREQAYKSLMTWCWKQEIFDIKLYSISKVSGVLV